ncbi:MAG: energy-coupling factor ABC transporter ATP-binding protein [Desulfobulbaceae bacterium]|nr:energy-coupling factor ABC transporter ATP-binding protein [Desulfobulbaceae bacterium]
MQNILTLRNVQYRYNGRTVLDIPKLDISRGSINGLAGPNGSGKTTLLKLLSFAEKSTTGTISYSDSRGNQAANNGRYRITLLPQESYLLKRSVYDNIVYGLKIRGISDNLPEQVRKALDLVGLQNGFAARLWDELSGGEAQRVALAARLILKPDCLLLDEPTASVDMESARNIRKAILKAQKEWGTTLIIASHNKSWLNDICDRIIYLYNGRILDFTYENVIPGPWERVDNRLFRTRLAEEQFFYVPAPPEPDSSAVIAPEALELSERDPSGSEKILHGVVTGIFFDKLQASPRVNVVCGDHRFIAMADDDIFTAMGFRPGRKVTLLYRPDRIAWLPK